MYVDAVVCQMFSASIPEVYQLTRNYRGSLVPLHAQ